MIAIMIMIIVTVSSGVYYWCSGYHYCTTILSSVWTQMNFAMVKIFDNSPCLK